MAFRLAMVLFVALIIAILVRFHRQTQEPHAPAQTAPRLDVYEAAVGGTGVLHRGVDRLLHRLDLVTPLARDVEIRFRRHLPARATARKNQHPQRKIRRISC